MATEDVDTVVLDTNVLLAATDPTRASHRQALSVFEDRTWQQRTLVLSGQVVREYLVVATRPVEQNGLELHSREALTNIAAFIKRTIKIDENELVRRRLRELLDRYELEGKRIHDANIVATMLARGVQYLLTENGNDFAFCPQVEVLPLRAEHD